MHIEVADGGNLTSFTMQSIIPWQAAAFKFIDMIDAGTHEGGEGVEQKRTQKCLFFTYFVIFSYARYVYHILLSLVSTFSAVLQTISKIIFLSLKCFTVNSLWNY